MFNSKKRALLKEIDNLKEIIKQQSKKLKEFEIKYYIPTRDSFGRRIETKEQRQRYNKTAYFKRKNKTIQKKENQNQSFKGLEKPFETNLSYIPDGQVMSEQQKQFLKEQTQNEFMA